VMRPGRRAGIGVPDLVIAAALLGLVASFAFYLLRERTAGSDVGVAQGMGIALGKRKLDSLRMMGYGAVAAGCDTVDRHYIRRWYVTTDPAQDRKSVELLVSWPLSAKHTISFGTLIGDDRYKAAR
jgi:hypothetical protein